jgi:5-methyltetrahydropteroyltriglutamate--homocysteine methyltransferase
LALPKHLLPTTVVGSYPQPDWLVDRQMLSKSVPRTRMTQMWRVPEAYLEQAQDDATIVAIRDMERAGIDIVTDGEIRRESYSNRFATALEGIDIENPAIITSRSGQATPVPRVVGKVSRNGSVELRDMEFLRRNTDRAAKITLPGPFTMSQQAKNEFYKDDEELAMALAAAVNAEALELQKAGADVIQLDEPWVRNDPAAAKRYAVKVDQSRPAGHHGADRRSHLLRLRRRRARRYQTIRLFLFGRARGFHRRADLDRGRAAQARSRRARRSGDQENPARRD